jgi:hypothetical protein
MIVGDFNMYRSTENRNMEGGNMTYVFTFNEIISSIGLQEIPLKGKNYTWSNMQEDPLLEQIDWCFTSTHWISAFLNTLMLPLSRPTSDHTPCRIQIGTSIPKAQIFRFENHWIQQPGFSELVQQVWNINQRANNIASRIAAKFKLLRRVLKRWGKSLSTINNTISSCNNVLLVLDRLEEIRPLYTQEFNFRNILKEHTLNLLERKKIFWRQRYTVRWTKFGDENTSFFHAAATQRFRFNTITELEDQNGTLITDHRCKEAIIWDEFNNRLGSTTTPLMLFDLHHLIAPRDLTSLLQSYTHDEIDKVVKEMPTNKAPGPDGFNGAFYKSCWETIKHDIYQLCDKFFSGQVQLTALNSSFITLIPKVSNPTTIGDYRPISLSSSALKIITKLMGNSLQKIIIPLVHINQYGFIKSRAIQDYLAWAFEYIYQCQKSKHEYIILKIDFMKAFDTIEHNTIKMIMRQLGFPNYWINWVTEIYSTATSAVLLN